MKISRTIKTLGAGLAVAASAVLFTAPGAQAANMVTPCNSNAYYQTIKTNGEAFCFANYGDVYVTVLNTITLSTGNNSGMVTYKSSITPETTSPLRPKWWRGSFGGAVNVITVHIR